MDDILLPPGPYFIRWGTNVYAGSPDSAADSRQIATTGGVQTGSKTMEQTSAENEEIARAIATLPELLKVVDAAAAVCKNKDDEVVGDLRNALWDALDNLARRRRELKGQTDAC